MSLITSCPNCGTMFRVVPDQLKISEGWVRCGHCSEVFDATAHLTDESLLVEPQVAQGAPRPPQPAFPDDEPPASVADMLEREEGGRLPRSVPEPLPADAVAVAVADAPVTTNRSDEPSDFFAEESEIPALEPSPLDAPFVMRRKELSERELLEGPQPGEESQMLPSNFDPLGTAPTREELAQVSFVRQARRRAFWRRPGVRLGLSFLSVLLAALLLLQVAYQDHDRLALAQPGLRPVLVPMCEVLGCALGPPRQIESIVIDSSGFNRLRNDAYRLNFTLRNAARHQVAAPAMELTITDAQDQPIARRVLTPDELGTDSVIPAAGEWSRSVGISLEGGSTRVAGYRLLAFYP